VQMPVMDGLTATRLIRDAEKQRGGHLPIIALTAQAMRDERERGLLAGMDGYVVKPFQAKTLLAEIETVVARSTGRQRSSDTVPDPPPAAPSVTPVFDRARALDRLGGDEALLDELIGIFMADVSSKRSAIESALVSGDRTLLTRAAHNTRGALLTLAAHPAADAAQAVEDAAAGNAGMPAEVAVKALAFELDLLAAELTRRAGS